MPEYGPSLPPSSSASSNDTSSLAPWRIVRGFESKAVVPSKITSTAAPSPGGATSKPLTYSPCTTPILNITTTVDGNYCILCCQDGTLRLANPHKALPIQTYANGHNGEVYDVAIASSNGSFCSVGRDKQAIIWDVATSQIVRKFRQHDGKVFACVLGGTHGGGGGGGPPHLHSQQQSPLPLEQILITAGYDKTVRFWDLRAKNNYKPLQTLEDARDSVTSLCLPLDSTCLYTSSLDGSCRCYDIRMRRVWEDDLSGGGGGKGSFPIGSLSLSSDKECICCFTLRSVIVMLERSNGSVLKTYQGHVNKNHRIHGALDPSDAWLVCGSEKGGKVAFWDILNSKPKAVVDAHNVIPPPPSSQKSDDANDGVCFVMHFHHERRIGLSGGADGVVKVWEPRKK